MKISAMCKAQKSNSNWTKQSDTKRLPWNTDGEPSYKNRNFTITNTLSLPDGSRGRVAKRLACATLDAAVSVWSPDWGSYDVFLVRTIVRTLSSHTVSFFTLMVEWSSKFTSWYRDKLLDRGFSVHWWFDCMPWEVYKANNHTAQLVYITNHKS